MCVWMATTTHSAVSLLLTGAVFTVSFATYIYSQKKGSWEGYGGGWVGDGGGGGGGGGCIRAESQQTVGG